MTTRFEVIDRQRGRSADLCNWSIVNPRYYVRDAETHEIVDELTTKREARAVAAQMNGSTRGD